MHQADSTLALSGPLARRIAVADEKEMPIEQSLKISPPAEEKDADFADDDFDKVAGGVADPLIDEITGI